MKDSTGVKLEEALGRVYVGASLEVERQPPTSGGPLCNACSGPGKWMQPASAARPHLYHPQSAASYNLSLCVDCGTLWVEPPYKVDASSLYFIAWPYSRELWQTLMNVEQGSIISRWCDYKILQAWPAMSEAERKAVQQHHQGTYPANAHDEAFADKRLDPLLPFLKASSPDEMPA